jgi:hypothetical protein
MRWSPLRAGPSRRLDKAASIQSLSPVRMLVTGQSRPLQNETTSNERAVATPFESKVMQMTKLVWGHSKTLTIGTVQMYVILILRLIISYKHNSLCIQIKFETFSPFDRGICMVQSISFPGLLLSLEKQPCDNEATQCFQKTIKYLFPPLSAHSKEMRKKVLDEIVVVLECQF